jgi:hypothetical protein
MKFLRSLCYENLHTKDIYKLSVYFSIEHRTSKILNLLQKPWFDFWVKEGEEKIFPICKQNDEKNTIRTKNPFYTNFLSCVFVYFCLNVKNWINNLFLFLNRVSLLPLCILLLLIFFQITFFANLFSVKIFN